MKLFFQIVGLPIRLVCGLAYAFVITISVGFVALFCPVGVSATEWGLAKLARWVLYGEISQS